MCHCSRAVLRPPLLCKQRSACNRLGMCSTGPRATVYLSHRSASGALSLDTPRRHASGVRHRNIQLVHGVPQSIYRPPRSTLTTSDSRLPGIMFSMMRGHPMEEVSPDAGSSPERPCRRSLLPTRSRTSRKRRSNSSPERQHKEAIMMSNRSCFAKLAVVCPAASLCAFFGTACNSTVGPGGSGTTDTDAPVRSRPR